MMREFDDRPGTDPGWGIEMSEVVVDHDGREQVCR
jgi:hypothetical protein